MPESLYPRPNDVNAPLRSTIGIGPRGPKGHSITAEVIDTDPYGYFRVQFKDAETDEVLVTTPNLDVGSRFFVCDGFFTDVEVGTQQSAVVTSFSTLQASSDRSAIRVGDIVLFTARTMNRTFISLDTIAVGVVNRVNGTNVSFITTNVMLARIINGGITTDMLGDYSVTTKKLASKSVTSDKIAERAISGNHIKDSSITLRQLSDDILTITPAIANPIEWSSDNEYDNFTIVIHEGNGYMSRRSVPSGIDIDNSDYWVQTSTYNAQLEEILGEINDLPFIYPEDYGAVGDGITDDTDALEQAFSHSNAIVFFKHDRYRTTRQIEVSGVSGIHINSVGTTTIIYDSENGSINNNQPIITFSFSEDLSIKNLFVTTNALESDNESTNILPLYTNAQFGILFNGCNNVLVDRCIISLVKDGIRTQNCDGVTIQNCIIRNTGQEPIVINESDFVLIMNNDLKWHIGEGVLIKSHLREIKSGPRILFNYIHDGKRYDIGGTIRLGGGISSNCEGYSSGYYITGMEIIGNYIYDTYYGVLIGNCRHSVVTNNICFCGLTDVNNNLFTGKCFGIEGYQVNNFTNAVLKDILFADNVAIGGRVGYTTETTGTVTCEDIKFINNTFMASDLGSTNYGFIATNSVLDGNVCVGGTHSASLTSCICRNNTFKDATAQSSDTGSAIYSTGPTIFENNYCKLNHINFSGTGFVVRNNDIFSSVAQPIHINQSDASGSGIFRDNRLNLKKVDGASVETVNLNPNMDYDIVKTKSFASGSGRIYGNSDFIHIWFDGTVTSEQYGTVIDTINLNYLLPKSTCVCCGVVGNGDGSAIIRYGTNGEIRLIGSEAGQLRADQIFMQ